MVAWAKKKKQLMVMLNHMASIPEVSIWSWHGIAMTTRKKSTEHI
jgi:hypothetical protein